MSEATERRDNLFGLSSDARARLIAKLSSLPPRSGDPDRLDATTLDGARELSIVAAAADYLGIADPFFRVHEGIAGATTVIDGRRYVNFSSYDYLALNGDTRIAEAAKAIGVTKVAFDRSGFQYHGRVKALADAAREAGLEI